MVRPLRIEYPGAVYHITSRGDRREPIAKDDLDRATFFTVLSQAFDRFDAHAWAYCLMGNHYHLVIRTRQANLSRLMRHINGVYTQSFNRRHQLSGHLFQGRFKAILVDSESYLLEVCRYVDLNPVRAQMVNRSDEYAWSSYRALSGLSQAPEWLDAESVYAQLAPGKSAPYAAAKYAEFVAQGKGVNLWDHHLKQQIYLGSDAFITRMQSVAGIEPAGQAKKSAADKTGLSKIQTSAPPKDQHVQHYAKLAQNSKAMRNQHIAQAFYQGGHTQTAIAQAFHVSSSTISRVIKEYEDDAKP
jgi:putative transposase